MLGFMNPSLISSQLELQRSSASLLHHLTSRDLLSKQAVDLI